jgi:hypothetical protein
MSANEIITALESLDREVEMSVHVQTGNMLDVVVEGKSIGLKQRDSDHRK